MSAYLERKDKVRRSLSAVLCSRWPRDTLSGCEMITYMGAMQARLKESSPGSSPSLALVIPGGMVTVPDEARHYGKR